MSKDSSLLVFTDLDGSLLDHHDYSFTQAIPVLEQLRDRGVPVIPTSSKTRSEIEVLRQELGSQHPFIVENGAAVFIPEGYFEIAPQGTVCRNGYWVKEFSAPRKHWLAVLNELAGEYKDEFDCFHQLGPEGIASNTGLSVADARHANARDYSEPVKWLGVDSRKAKFVLALRSKGANPLQGGRFLTVAGDCDKARALVWLRQVYEASLGPVQDIAIGDSGNDVAMLEAAQSALVVRSPVHDFPQLERALNVEYSTGFGPVGWAEGVQHWLESATGS
ncbi:MAG: HAD-IIB family hydrolase [Halioglobus sp.]